MDQLIDLLGRHWAYLLTFWVGWILMWGLRKLWRKAVLELEAIDRAERLQKETYQRERRWVERDGHGPE